MFSGIVRGAVWFLGISTLLLLLLTMRSLMGLARLILRGLGRGVA